MISPMIISLIAVALVATVSIGYALKTAAVGYEDEFGFHEGLDPQRGFSLDAASLAEPAAFAPRPAARAKRAPRPSVSKRLESIAMAHLHHS